MNRIVCWAHSRTPFPCVRRSATSRNPTGISIVALSSWPVLTHSGCQSKWQYSFCEWVQDTHRSWIWKLIFCWFLLSAIFRLWSFWWRWLRQLQSCRLVSWTSHHRRQRKVHFSCVWERRNRFWFAVCTCWLLEQGRTISWMSQSRKAGGTSWRWVQRNIHSSSPRSSDTSFPSIEGRFAPRTTAFRTNRPHFCTACWPSSWMSQRWAGFGSRLPASGRTSSWEDTPTIYSYRVSLHPPSKTDKTLRSWASHWSPTSWGRVRLPCSWDRPDCRCPQEEAIHSWNHW